MTAPRNFVRRTVRQLVEKNPELVHDAALRQRLARAMVSAGDTAADLIAEEQALDEQIARRVPVAQAANAGRDFQPGAVSRAGQAVRDLREAIDFPGFVTNLLTGVFQAITTSNLQQLQAFADLLEAVNTGVGQFANQQIDDARAAQWASQRFSGLVFTPPPRAGEAPDLQVGDSGRAPEERELREALGLSSEEARSVDSSDLMGTLVPLVKRKLARDRQSVLATMVLMGMNRVVVDEGRLHASMDMVVDARSMLEQQEQSRTDFRLNTSASGSFGMGMWGASASMSASVGYVRSNQEHSQEEMAARAGLRSSVDVTFHTEPFPLNRMANASTRRTLQDRSMVPEAERQSQPLLPTRTIGERRLQPTDLGPLPDMPTAAPPDSQAARDQRRRRDYSEGGADGPARPEGGGGQGGAGQGGAGQGGAGQGGAGQGGAVGQSWGAGRAAPSFSAEEVAA